MERVIVFATILYGGFESKHQVYDSFTKDFDTINTVTRPLVKIERQDKRVNNGKMTTWQSEINGIYSRVRIEKPYVNLSQRYLNTIRFDNSDGNDINFEGKMESTTE